MPRSMPRASQDGSLFLARLVVLAFPALITKTRILVRAVNRLPTFSTVAKRASCGVRNWNRTATLR
jgi:hypothetical protein